MIRQWVTLVLALLCSSVDVTRAFAESHAARLTVVISDLHFGVGKTAGGAWHATEDFRWPNEFEMFLDAIHAQGAGRVTLVLNGDTFELWQSLAQFTNAPDCVHQSPNLGCEFKEAQDRLRRTMDAHARELKALGDFAKRDENRVVIVPGNHDAALLWKPLADEVVARTGAAPPRIQVSATGYWRSEDGRVFVEHGHEIAEDPNRFCRWPLPCSWPRPFLAGATPPAEHLARPWGEQFVQSFYNRYEAQYPIIDNLASEALGVRYGIATEGLTGAAGGGWRFVKFLLTQESWTQFAQLLGQGDRPPDWDIEALRASAPKDFMIASLSPDDPLRQLLAADSEPVPALSNEEIRAICERREASRDPLPPDRKDDIPPCPRLQTLRSTAEAFYKLVARDRVFRAHLEARRQMLAPAREFDVFVYSHTHRAEEAFSPFANEHGPWRPVVVNSGAWQRVATEHQIKRLLQSGRPLGEVLRMSPENLPACYSAILIDEADKSLDPVLRWWHRANAGWQLSPPTGAPECPETEIRRNRS